MNFPELGHVTLLLGFKVDLCLKLCLNEVVSNSRNTLTPCDNGFDQQALPF